MLEPVVAYLEIAQAQYENIGLAGAYNVGPDDIDCLTTGDLVSLFCEKWNNVNGTNINWINKHDGGPHEATFLKLDCSKLKQKLSWKPKWSVEITMENIVEWYKSYSEGTDVGICMQRQINDFLEI